MKQVLKITQSTDKNGVLIYSTDISVSITFKEFSLMLEKLTTRFYEIKNKPIKSTKMKTEKTEMANYIIDDGQSIRGVWNYLSQTFDGIKDVELFDSKFKTREEFYCLVKDVCDMMLEANRDEMLDNA